MKKFGFVLLAVTVLLTFCTGVLPVYASDNASITITPYRTMLMVGQSAGLTVSATPSNMEVEIAIDDESVLSYDDAYKMITGLKEGTAVITATGTDPTDGETIITSVTIAVCNSTGLIGGTDYYIMNASTKKVLSLASASDANSINIDSRARGESSLSQWTVVKNTDGTIRLQSVYSSTGRSAYVSGSNLILYNSTGARTKLNIHRITSGRHQGLYQIRYNNQLLCMNSSGDVYFGNTLNAGSHWSFMPADKGVADIASHDYSYNDEQGELINFNTALNNEYFVDVFENFGYTAYSETNQLAYYAYLYMRTEDDVFVFSGHGGPGVISFCTTNNISTGAIAVSSSVANRYEVGNDRHYINSCEDNELASLRCVLYLGCNTGKNISIYGYTYNLVDATYAKGAHYVLGTTKTLNTGHLNEWLEYFLDNINTGTSIQTAIELANLSLGNIQVSYIKDDDSKGTETVYGLPIYAVGDDNQFLN
ncbi:MAG: RICIN domain-containing protein [Eubacteriales bacterium]